MTSLEIPRCSRPFGREHADAALAVAIIRQERAGTSPGSGTFDEKLRIYCHIMRLNIEEQDNERHQAGVVAL
jgi:hypothetical protein